MQRLLNALLLFTILSILFIHPSFAQTASLSGVVTGNGVPAPDAPVVLLHAADSSLYRSVLSGDNGRYAFNDLKPGSYLLNVQALGFSGFIKPVNIVPGANVHDAVLVANVKDLNEVTVTDRRPLMEVAPGKTVFNVEQSVTAAGDNVLDLLRKSPGVTISGSGDISMQGKQGVTVMVDDKPTYLSGDDLAQFLRSLPAGQVARIELITQPSAKYDAEGHGGIINIQTKKNKSRGLNGTAAGHYTIGRYAVYNADLALYYTAPRLNMRGGMRTAGGTYFMTQDINRVFRDRQTLEAHGTMQQSMYLEERPSGNDLYFGVDYDLSKKTTIGIYALGNYNPVPYNSVMDAVITDSRTGQVIYNHANFYAGQVRKRASANAYVSHSFSEKSQVRINLDYLKYWMKSYPFMISSDRDSTGRELYDPLILNGVLPIDIDVYNLRLDYEHSFGKKLRIESGWKSSFVNTANEARYEVWQNRIWVYDTVRNNRFVYTEQINAAYVNAFVQPWEKWELQAGLRAEHTHAKGVQSVHDQQFTRDYLSLFPTLYIGFTPDSNNRIDLNYGRRIQRPEYRSLNPFIKFASQYHYDVGNPGLQPQFSDNIELRHSFRNKLFTTLGYTHTDALRQQLIIVDDVTKKSYSRPENLGSSDRLGLSLMYNDQLTEAWQLSASASAFFVRFSGVVNGYSSMVEGMGWDVNITNRFTFSKGWNAECQLGYGAISRETILKTGGGWITSEFGVGRRMLKDRLRISVAVEDPFNLSEYRDYARLRELEGNGRVKFYTQLVRLGFSFRLGGENNSRARENRLSEEQQRL